MYRIKYIDRNFKFNTILKDITDITDVINEDTKYIDVEDNVNINLPNNKFFDNDIIDNEFNILKSDVRKKFHVGYFSTSSTITFGKTKNGKKLYQLNSLNYNLPKFKISYNGKLKGKILVVFKYLNWNDNIPQASIIDIIGLFNEENIKKAYIYYFYLSSKKLKKEPKINLLENSIERKDITHIYTISIDPKGSKDIDDAIGMDTEYVYISIAQPISYMSLEDIIEISKTRFSTLYLGDNEISLFGDKITEMSSLLEKQERNAYTLKFDINGILIDHFPSIVKVNKNLSYGYVNDNKEQLINLFNFSKNIFKNINCAEKLVENWMIHANCSVGNILEKTIYRINNTSFDIINNVHEKDKEYFYDASDYVYQNKNNNNKHNILGVDNYLHFTSPIRRIVDNIIHFQLTYNTNLGDEKQIMKFVNNINDLAKKTSRFHRMLILRKNISELDDNINVEGKIIDVNMNRMKILIPSLGIINYYNDINIELYHENMMVNVNLQKVNNIYPNKMLVLTLENEENLFYQ